MTDTLAGLDTDELAERLIGASTPEATIRVLQRSPEVQGVTCALAEGAVDGNDIRAFVANLLSAFRPGVAFNGDSTLGALAVALAPISGPFTEDFLRRLAALRFRELSMSPRVAALLLTERNRSFSTTTSAEFRISLPLPTVGQRPSPSSPFRVRVEQSDSRHTIAA